MAISPALSRSALIFAFLVAAGSCASASAQSMEYRRGYEQGFRDGAASVQPGGPPPAAHGGYGGFHGPIIIDEARYGFRDANCDARPALQQMSERQQYVEFRVDNGLCGDPARDRVKRIDVRYRCGNGPEHRLAGREGDVLALSCR